MSRFQGRHSSGDLAYGEEPQRWDRDRFERYRRAPPVEERETFRFTEHDRPGRQDIRIEDRIDRGPPPRRFEERERDIFAEDRFGPPARPRRSDRELFGGQDPREYGDLQVAPYRRKSIVERDIDFRETSRTPRPGGLVRRPSSLDAYDRRPMPRYERDEYHIPAGVPIPLPRRRSPSRGPPGGYYEDEYEDVQRYRDYSPQDSYRDVEIMRERSVHRRRRSRAESDARSVTTKRSGKSGKSTKSRKSAKSTRSSSVSSSSSSSSDEVSRHSSPERKVGKKGKTRMPKRLVRKQAIIDMALPFEEEEDFFVVQRALGKDQIDEVIRISEMYKSEPRTTTYRYDDPPAMPEEHYEHLRTEWINPPSVRAPSPARSTRTRRTSPARTVRQPSPAPQPTTIYIREPAQPAPPPQPIYIREPAPPPPPPQPIYIREPAPPAPPQQQPMTIVLPERRREHSRDVHAEIRKLEAEAAAVRLEREAHAHREMIIRRPEERGYEIVEYSDRRPDREIVEYVDRERARSPPRNVVRVEKDRKGRMALVRSAR